MAVESYFLKHDYNSRNDKKMVKLLQKESISGVGIYWCIVEMLYEEGGTLMLDECESIAFALRTKPDVVRRVVINYELFKNDGTKFWSESALRRMQARAEKSNVARETANKRWNKAKHDANALPASSESNAKRGEEKEKREEERRVRRETLSLSEFKLFLDEQFLEVLRMNHKGKDIDKAIGEAYAHLAAQPQRLQVIDAADAKKLVNTWLSNTKQQNDRRSDQGANATTKPFSTNYSVPL